MILLKKILLVVNELRKRSAAQANFIVSTVSKVDWLLVAVSIKVPLLSTGYHIPHAPAAGSAVASRARAHTCVPTAS